MNDAWLKIKAWTKGIVIALFAIYALIFIYNNSGVDKHVDFWWWFGKIHETTVFLLALWGFLAGVVTTGVLLTTWNTLRQLRAMRHQARTERLERDMADMQAKAALLQPRPGLAPAAASSVPVDRLGDVH